MRYKRMHIPETIIFYMFVFMTLVSVLLGSLGIYYHEPGLETRFGNGFFALFNLDNAVNFLNWFYSVLWFLVVVEAFIIFSLARENQLKISLQLFWLQVAILSVVFSANSICGFFPFLQKSFDSWLTSAGYTPSSVTIIYAVIRLVLGAIAFVELSFLFSFIWQQKISRFFLSLCIFGCIFLFATAWFCHCQIPMETRTVALSNTTEQKEETALKEQKGASDNNRPDDSSSEEKDDYSGEGMVKESDSFESDTLSDRSTETAPGTSESMDNESSNNEIDSSNADNKNTKTGTERPKPVRVRGLVTQSEQQRSPFRNAARETSLSEEIDGESSETGVIPAKNVSATQELLSGVRQPLTHWEEIFGWQKTFEETFGLSQSIEEKFGWNRSIEMTILGSNQVEVDIYRFRKTLRYGTFGLALIALCTTIGLVARGGRIRITKEQKKSVDEILRWNDAINTIRERP